MDSTTQQAQPTTSASNKHKEPEKKKKKGKAESSNQPQVMPAVIGESFDEQLAAFLSEIQLTEDEIYLKACYELQMIFRSIYPGCRTYPFGSTVTGLAFVGSDLDVYMDLGLKRQPSTEEEVNTVFNTAKKLLYRHNNLYARIIPIPRAKTPIIKFVHRPTNISCDLNFKNALGIRNTNLIKFYLSLDQRLKPLLMIIKFWTKKHGLSGPGKMSHYSLVMLVLFYLQQLEKPIIPPVTNLQQSCPEYIIDHWNSGFNGDASLYSANGNETSIPVLLRDFFKFCAAFDYSTNVICPLMGKSLMKSLFLTPDKLPVEQNRYKQFMKSVKDARPLRVDCIMCIQDPFELRHNLTGGVGAKTLEIFKCYCEYAEKVCSKALLNTDPKNSQFFIKIVGETMKPELPNNRTNKCVISLSMWKHFRPPEMDDVTETENTLQSKWYTSVFETMMEIFHKVLKFQTENIASEESDDKVEKCKKQSTNEAQKVREESSSKVQKLEGQSDVGERLKSDLETKVFLCVAYHPVWQNRKERTEKLVIPQNLPTVEKEQAISDLLIDEEQNSKIHAKFLCVFQPKKSPTGVNIQILNRLNRKEFQPMFSFLKKWLPLWIEQCLNEKQKKWELEQSKNRNTADEQ